MDYQDLLLTNPLYFCKKYCFKYYNTPIWLNNETLSQICFNDKQAIHTISDLTCYDLLIDKNDVYKKPSNIENLCSSRIIKSTINCPENELSFVFK